jgi:hypothetical protein
VDGGLVASWARLHARSPTVSTVVLFVHVASLIVGGGLAIALDRATLKARAALRHARREHLLHLASGHRIVTWALAIALASGLALVAADADSYLASWVFWLKMVLLALLVANGRRVARLGVSIQRDLGHPDGDWESIRSAALASIALWLALTLAGVALKTVA